jgi:hypothetical protein
MNVTASAAPVAPEPRPSGRWAPRLAALLWLLLVVITAWHHEFWRDEVRAFSIAVGAPSLWELPALLRDEGHPVLWYALLHMGFALTHSAYVLPVTAALIAAAAVLLFLYRAPFALGLKLLFVFSVLPLYEYAVMARNYGISMLLMFAFAALYPRRRQQPLVLALLLAALANTNVHSLLLAGILTGLWLWDDAIVGRSTLTARDGRMLAVCCTLVAAAAVGAVATVLPDGDTIVTPMSRPPLTTAIVTALTHPWKSLNLVLPMQWGVLPDSLDHGLKDALIAGVLLGLVLRPILMIALGIALVGFGLIFQLVYGGALRHQGLLLVFALVLYWLLLERPPRQRAAAGVRALNLGLWVVWPMVLLWGDYQALLSVSTDLRYEVSSVKSLAAWLDARAQYRSAVIIGEPDWLLEALPYYSAAPIYIPREGRFGKWTHLTRASAATFTLNQLLDAAEAIGRTDNRPVLIALGLPAADLEQGLAPPPSYGRSLQWTSAQWQRFKDETSPVASFRAAVYDENFDLYEVRSDSGAR